MLEDICLRQGLSERGLIAQEVLLRLTYRLCDISKLMKSPGCRDSLQNGKIFQLYFRQGLISRIHKSCKRKLKITNHLINKYASERKRQLSKEIQISNKYWKTCLNSSAIKGMWIKTTLRFLFVLVKMAAIKKITTGRRHLDMPAPHPTPGVGLR